jgi:phosphopantothenoylcysteine decarboxylase/phosphopantothenate--cysteine ligase
MSRILLGVSGGIAAYKALEFVRLATGAGHAVRVVQTPASRRFVGSASFAALSGAPVLVDEFERDPARGAFPGQRPPEHDPIGHLELVRNADLYLIAPASANTVAKLAGGHAENLLTSAALAATCPLVIAPAMNNHMYEHPAVQANLATLRARGATVLEPDSGCLASKGEQGVGRLPDPARLLEACEALLAERSPRDAAHESTWRGLRVLVTAGGTREPIDAVRFIGNRSSGRMGMALAAAAAKRGAEVTVVAANVSLPEPAGVKRIDVETTAELSYETVERFETQHVLLMAAAPADFRTEPITGKIKRQDSLNLNLQPTEDILARLAGERGEGQTLVGFAAEHGGDAVARARAKLARKGADLIVLNDVSDPTIGFESPENEVLLVTAADEEEVPKAPKDVVAEAILDRVDRLRAAGAKPAPASG